MTGKPRSGEEGEGEVNTAMQRRDATPPAQATSPKRSKKLKMDRHGDNPPESRSRTRTITTKTQ